MTSALPAGVTWRGSLALEEHEDSVMFRVPSVSAAVAAMTGLAFGIYLRATPQRVCQALADPGLVPGWLSGLSSGPAGEEDPRRLTCEWLLADYLEVNGGCASVVRFDLVAMGQVTRLTVSHRGLYPGGSLLKAVTPGWPMILSSLKSLVETGEPLEFRLSA
jgi:activator of Hsp90 ATPase-like protein